MFPKKTLLSLLAPFALTNISQAAVALYIDDFADQIGESEESDIINLGGSPFEALIVNADPDPSDTATVSQTTPAGTNRTASLSVTAPSTSSITGIVATTSNFLVLQIEDGVAGTETGDFIFDYDFTPIFDATAGGLLDTVELEVSSSDWGPTKGTLNVDFIEDSSGDIATWSITPTVGVQSATLVSLSGAGSVDFSQISDVRFRLEGGNDIDLSVTEFGLSGTGIPEPSSALLALLGSGFLIARRRRA